MDSPLEVEYYRKLPECRSLSDLLFCSTNTCRNVCAFGPIDADTLTDTQTERLSLSLSLKSVTNHDALMDEPSMRGFA